MYGIQVEDSQSGVTVGMRGEFDAFTLPEMRETLDEACAFGKPVMVDLSGITFLDVQSTRELVVRSLIQAHQLAFDNPSSGVLASVRALGMEDETPLWIGPEREGPQVFSGA